MAKFSIELTSGDDLFPSSDFPDIPQGDSVEVTAFEGNDTVGGTSLGDLILGNGGNDSLTGNNGDDTIYGGQGNDIITDLSGNNLLLGNGGNDIITSGSGNDTIYAGQDDDVINSGAGDDSIFSGLGDSEINSGAGDDTVYGGEGDDTITDEEGSNLLLGNQGDDIIIGSTESDTIYGGKEDDTITAGKGADHILGGLGDDLILFNEGDVVAGEIIEDTGGFDTLSFLGDNDITTATISDMDAFSIAEGATVTSTLDQADSVETIEGTGILKINASSADIIASGVLSKIGSGITIENADGEVVNPPLPTVITGTEGPDLISPEADVPLKTSDISEVISGLGDNDIISGAGGDDSIDGGDGDDEVWGNAGTDSVSGGAGNDTLGIAEGDVTAGETYDGGEDTDTLWASASADVSGSTVINIETVTIANGAILTTTLAQVSGEGSAVETVGISAEDGAESPSATLQVLATTDEILASDLGDKIGAGVIVTDVEGTIVEFPSVKTITGTDAANEIIPEAQIPDFVTTDEAEVINALGGDDTVKSIGGDDTIDGGDGNDKIWGGTGKDNLSGGAGDDKLYIMEGDDVAGEMYDGGEGADILEVKATADVSESTVTNIEGISILNGETLMATLAQVTGEESAVETVTISAEEGAETVAATLQIMDESTDEEIQESGIFDKIADGVIIFNADGEVVLPPINEITGTDEADLISMAEDADFNSTNSQDFIDALGGDDEIFGAGGDDIIEGGEGNDSAWGGADKDMVMAGAGDDVLGIAEGDAVEGETYDGGEGTDTLYASATADVSTSDVTDVEIFTLANTVILTVTLDQAEAATSYTVEAEGNTGTVQITTALADLSTEQQRELVAKAGDGITVVDANDVVITDPGADGTFTGTENADTITPDDVSEGVTADPEGTTPGDAADNISGEAGADTLSGGGGNDTISGGEGADEITGGTGKDNLSGDTGNDTFMFAAGDLASGEVIDGGEPAEDAPNTDNDVADFSGTNAFTGVTITNVETINLSGTLASLTSVNIAQITDVADILGTGTVQFNATTAEVQQQIYGTKNVESTVKLLNSEGEEVPINTVNNTFTIQPNDNVTGPGNLFAYQLRNENTDNFIDTLNTGDMGVGTGDDPVTLFAQLGELIFSATNPIIQNTLPTLENVNTIDLEVRGAGSRLNLTRTMGTEFIVIHDSADDVRITNIGNSLTSTTVTDFTIKDQGENVTLGFNDAVFGEDGLKVSLEAVTGGNLTINGTTGDTLNLASNTDVNELDGLSLGNSGINNINVTGDQALEIDNAQLIAGGKLIDASAFEGDFTFVLDDFDGAQDQNIDRIEIKGGTKNDTITINELDVPNPSFLDNYIIETGTGDDAITFSRVNEFNGNDSVDGGNGDGDSLSLAYNANPAPDSANPLKIVGIETLELNHRNPVPGNPTADIIILDLKNVVGITEFEFPIPYVEPPAPPIIQVGDVFTLANVSNQSTLNFTFSGSDGNLDTDVNLITPALTVELADVSGEQTATVNYDNGGNAIDRNNDGVTGTIFGFTPGRVQLDGVEKLQVNFADGALGIPGTPFEVQGNSFTDLTFNDVDGSNPVNVALFTVDNTNVSLTDNADTAIGSDNNDFIVAGSGNDVVSGGLGLDTIQGADGLDTLAGGLNDDTLRGGAGNDSLVGGSLVGGAVVDDNANNFFTGGIGNDTFNVTGSNSFIITDLEAGDAIVGDDSLAGDVAVDLDGTNGNDLITTTGGDDTLNGLDGNDTLTAAGGNDELNGGNGNDVLTGGADGDVLTGGAGNDRFELQNGVTAANTFTNNAGNATDVDDTDVFTFVNVNARDIITDFVVADDSLVTGTPNNYTATANATAINNLAVGNYSIRGNLDNTGLIFTVDTTVTGEDLLVFRASAANTDATAANGLGTEAFILQDGGALALDLGVGNFV